MFDKLQQKRKMKVSQRQFFKKKKNDPIFNLGPKNDWRKY